MATKKWFVNKDQRLSYVPATFEGWLVTLIYFLLVFMLTVIYLIRLNDPLFAPLVSTLIYLFLFSLFTICLLWICYATGEKIRWPGKK